MTVVHDNECMKNKKTMFKNSYLSRNNSEETIESMTLKTNEHNDQKRKSNPVFLSITCLRIVPSLFFRSSYSKHHSILYTYAFLLITDSYIICSSYKVI